MMRGIGGEGFLFSIFFHFRVSPGYRQSIAGNVSCLELSCLVLSAAAAAAEAGLLLLLLLVYTCCWPVAAAYLPTTELRAPQGVAPVSLVGRFTLTVVTVVKLASHCVFQQNHSK